MLRELTPRVHAPCPINQQALKGAYERQSSCSCNSDAWWEDFDWSFKGAQESSVTAGPAAQESRLLKRTLGDGLSHSRWIATVHVARAQGELHAFDTSSASECGALCAQRQDCTAAMHSCRNTCHLLSGQLTLMFLNVSGLCAKLWLSPSLNSSKLHKVPLDVNKFATEPARSDVLLLEDYLSARAHSSNMLPVPRAKVRFTHIPKAAGTAFMFELSRLGVGLEQRAIQPDGSGFVPYVGAARTAAMGSAKGSGFERFDTYYSETCYPPWRVPSLPNVVLLRDPRALVLSQYVMCRYSLFGRISGFVEGAWARGNNLTALGVEEGFEMFLEHYNLTPHADLPCYNPVNMQTRALTCRSAVPAASHKWQPVHGSRQQDALRAIKAQGPNALDVVGLSEFLEESVCIVAFHATHKLPPSCACQPGKRGALSVEPRLTHGMPPHNVSSLSKNVLDKIDAITCEDHAVYAAGVRRFLDDTEHMENVSGLRVLCDHARVASLLRRLHSPALYGLHGDRCGGHV